MQKEVRNKVVSQRRARAVGMIGGPCRSQHTRQRHRNISSESKNVRCQFFQKINGLEWMNSRLGKWDKNRNHQEENQNFSCHVYYPSLSSPQLLTTAVHLHPTNYSKQAFSTRCYIQSTLSHIFIIDLFSQKQVHAMLIMEHIAALQD